MKKVLAIMLVTLIVLGVVGYVAAQHRRPLPPPPPPVFRHPPRPPVHHPPAHGGHRTNTYTYQGYYVDGGPPNCFIATSVYGEGHGATSILRSFRDKRLTATLGRKLVAFYYGTGPTVAKALDGNDFLKPIVKVAFYPIVGACYLIN